ncbi:hypothetical protein [Crinalium epipsammum]|uniref:hypothetical protein n=1 Tax=Crinalium epipsammum TaxID=241425 RepID=UPI000314CD8C|nr:hypothetical protein [Crinalium epipsammum]
MALSVFLAVVVESLFSVLVHLEAINWYKKSSLQGYGVASNNLAGMLLAGCDRTSASTFEADKLFRIAREQGFLHAPQSSDYL